MENERLLLVKVVSLMFKTSHQHKYEGISKLLKTYWWTERAKR